MTSLPERAHEQALEHWVANRKGTTAPLETVGAPTLRFEFYARMSTTEFQDRASSRSWRREAATELIRGHGRIVAEYIDVGHTRSRPWCRRPRAAALLEAVTAPDRSFDAIVVGEYERVFAGRQLQALMPLLDAHSVALWLPELDGPVQSSDPVHAAALLHLAARSKQEIQRARFRVLAAMRAQVLEQGRYQGGRPPYGYRLADAGPHPNARHAQWGRRVHRLEPDTATAINVRWMFAQRRPGHHRPSAREPRCGCWASFCVGSGCAQSAADRDRGGTHRSPDLSSRPIEMVRATGAPDHAVRPRNVAGRPGTGETR